MKQPLVWAVSLFVLSMPDWAQSAAAEGDFDARFGGFVTPHGLSATPDCDPAPSNSGAAMGIMPSVFDAIEKEDAEWIEDHMKSNPGDLEGVVCNKRGPLRYAVSRQRPKSVKCLLTLGADPNVPDRFEQTAIFSAVHKYIKAKGTAREQKAELILKLLTFYPKTDLKKKSDMCSVEMYMPENMKNDYRVALMLQSIYKAEEKESESASSASSAAASASSAADSASASSATTAAVSGLRSYGRRQRGWGDINPFFYV